MRVKIFAFTLLLALCITAGAAAWTDKTNNTFVFAEVNEQAGKSLITAKTSASGEQAASEPVFAGPPAAPMGLGAAHEVFISIPEEYGEMGTYKVFVKEIKTDGTESLIRVYPNLEGKFVFETQTLIRIEAVPYLHHEFIEFKQNFKSELTEHDVLEIVVLTDREFMLSFKKTVYGRTGSVPPEDMIQVSHNEFQLDDEIFVSLYLDSIYEVKDFKINGISVSSEGYIGNVSFTNNVAAIKIDADWLTGYGGALDIEVTTKLNDIFLIALLLGSVLIPGLILLTVFLLVIGKKQKKAALGSLQVLQAHQYRTNTGTFIAGLKDGSFSGHISDKDIKEEIKKKNEKQPK